MNSAHFNHTFESGRNRTLLKAIHDRHQERRDKHNGVIFVFVRAGSVEKNIREWLPNKQQEKLTFSSKTEWKDESGF
jgi:hypothetical protein